MDCKYYPCHNKKELSCIFCHCPIYPCGIPETNGKWIKHEIWDCSGCTIIHDKSFVELIQKYIRDEVYKSVVI